MLVRRRPDDGTGWVFLVGSLMAAKDLEEAERVANGIRRREGLTF